jgi:4-amino-4-deoxy-L-arabinose transferase-like glycosyltransferase
MNMYSRVGKEQEAVETGPETVEADPTPTLTPTAPLLLQTLVLCSLGLAALIPRLILANQLDLITDEIIYILAGKSYIPLLSHITTSIGADGWQVNYEHPPLVKFLIGLSILGNNNTGHPFNELLAARIPSIIAGTTFITAIYWLGRKPFGQVVAFVAALCLAFSPWLVYFSSIAYLDMTMTTFITIAYLLTWHATHRPWLYLCVALFVSLGIDSKYTASLIIPGILLFTTYYFFVFRLRLPASQRPSIPWPWWLMAAIFMPLCFFALDPAIWLDPPHTLLHSVLFEWNHSVGGHLTFLAGSYNLHVPHWTVFYIIINKITAFSTVPAAIFAIIAPIQLIRFHLSTEERHHKGNEASDRKGREGASPSSIHLSQPDHCIDNGLAPLQPLRSLSVAFLFIWLLTTFAMLSLLNIVVGTHYLLPLAPPTVIAGAYTLVALARYSIRKAGRSLLEAKMEERLSTNRYHMRYHSQFNVQSVSIVLVIGVILVGPHLLGLLNTAEAEGYTSEFFQGENQTLQVAYPGYREAVQWLDTHTQGDKAIGLVTLPQTLQRNDPNVSWFAYNSNLPKRFQIHEAHPNDPSYPYNYLVWPMHLIQRGYLLPQSWHIVHTITGGDTTYCYIAAAPHSSGSIHRSSERFSTLLSIQVRQVSPLEAGFNLS